MAGGSGDGNIEASPGTIPSVAGWVDKTAEDFRDDVEALMRDVELLLEKWRGSAADTHADAWSDWYGNAKNLVDALGDDANALRTAAGAYAATDDDTSTGVSQAGTGSYELNI